MSIRTERVASVVKERIGQILVQEYGDPELGFFTVTDVKMTPDLKIAKVYVSVFGNEAKQERAMRMLESEKARIRSLVGSHLRLKFTPALQFYRDTTLDRVDRINRLINRIHDDGTQPSPETSDDAPPDTR